MRVRFATAAALLLAFLALSAPAHAADAPADSAAVSAGPPLQEAHQLYDIARFSDAVDLLTAAIRDGKVTGDDVNRARELLARCLVKANRPLEAKEAFKSVLREDATYRPDPLQVPPDELDVFKLALREFQAEQLEAGRRFPASIAFDFGAGQAVNQEIVDLASSAGIAEADDFKSNAEFGYTVRFPLKPRWSLDVELNRMRATTSDKLTTQDHANYTATGLPIVASVYYSLRSTSRWHLNGFAGAGPMAGEAIVEFTHDHFGRLIPVQIVGRSTGVYLHGGVEAEYLPVPRFAITGRALARFARSGELHWEDSSFEVYQGFPASTLGSRKVDFSGLAANVGVRFYIGY
jgi:hypothetical protein